MSSIIPVTKPSMPDMDEYIAELKDIWDSRWITNMGAKHHAFAAQLKDYLQADNIELFVNGHMALEMTIQAFELSGEVITTPFTFASTPHAIIRNGLKPVFCDIREDDFTIDADKIEGLITGKTCAIMPVHVYGNICDVDRIQEIADRHGLKVIYDAAHTFGESLNGRSAGTFGDAAIYSFHATKAFHSIEGGAACFREAALGERLYSLKNFGISGPESVTGVGANAKMNEFCAAMGICNLRHIDEEIAKRQKVDQLYRDQLAGVKGITLPRVQANVKKNYAYFPVTVEEDYPLSRDELHQRLADQGVIARKYFYPIATEYDCYRGSYDSASVPVAARAGRRVLTLPIFADLGTDDVCRICEIIQHEGDR